MAIVTTDKGTYDPMLPSIENPDGRVFQVLVTDPATGEVGVDMAATVAAATAALQQ